MSPDEVVEVLCERVPEAAVYVADRLPGSFTALDVVDALAAIQADEEDAVGFAASRFTDATVEGILEALLSAEWASASGGGYVLHRGALPF